MTDTQKQLLADCLAPDSTRCTKELRSILEVLARDAGRYHTVRRLLQESFGNWWSAEEYDARIDARVK